MVKYNKLFAVLLVFVMIFILCSCKGKTEDESTSETNTTAAANSVETTGLTTETEPSQTETQTTQTTTQPTETTSETTTQAQTQTATEVIVTTGVETVKDGSKTIVYPALIKTSSYRYPVIAWANGTGEICKTENYSKLLGMLANGGYIVVADDSVMAGDGTAQIDSINYIINQNSNPSSIFYNKVNTSAIGVCGHSQGGRSCVNAAKADSRIRAVVSIAGASNADEAGGLNTPSLFLAGSSDFVVLASQWCLPSYNAVTGRAAYASLKGGIHTTCMTNPEKVSGYTLSWFDAYLKNDSNAKAVFSNGGQLANDGNWQDFKNKN